MSTHARSTLVHHTALAIAAALACASVQAQTWEYRSYKKGGMGGQYDKNRFVDGTISVDQKDGNAVLHFNAGPVDICVTGAVPVDVQKTDQTTTVTVPPKVAGCAEFRYVINNDGSGGVRQVKRGEEWVNDGFDHMLKPKK